MLNEIEALQQYWSGPQSLTQFGLNLSIGVIIALVIQLHFNRYASTLSNRSDFSKIFVPLVLTTILIISVVKSSLALSLGLVGALSIVRFRTPIKEPEELIYLFLSIAVGLGLGANQPVITVFSSTVILLVTILLARFRSKQENQNIFLSIAIDSSNFQIDEVHTIVNKYIKDGNLRRFSVDPNETQISYQISLRSFHDADQLTKELKEKFSNVQLSFIDQNNIPHV